jgi:hypothetical protein
MTTPTAPPALTTAPDFPALADRAAGTYNSKAYTWATHWGTTGGPQVKALADNAFTNATAANEAAVDADADRIATAADRLQTGLDAAAASASAIQASKLNLGNKTSPPSVDNQGDILLAGATYYDTTLSKWRVWNGAAWVDGVSAVAGVSSLNGQTGAILVKTIGGVSILGSGDITASPDPIRTPANVTPASAATGVIETPALTASAYLSLYGLAQNGAQFQVSTSSGFGTVLHDSGTLGAVSTHTLPAAVLGVSTAYWWRARYRDADNVWSAWSAATTFTTAASFNNYIATPTATPANFGGALDGGFYAGMIWEEVTQSATSRTLATGAQTFTTSTNMAATPLFYSGQQVEVRSRANPANRFQGTVTGAIGTTLSVSVSTITGSGTFADWSVMARYRVIVAPKSSGENASVTIKNANTALPTACQTLNDGWAATEAMRTADTSTVYPAAHWARNLNIGSRTDWYVPARDELELLWRNLKPVTNNNYVTADRPTGQSYSYANNGAFGDTANTHGLNNNSAPPGAAYTTSVPGQVAATAFRTGGAEAFEFGSAYYWSSTDYNASTAWFQGWDTSSPGYQSNSSKANAFRVRAVRRSII